jgi:AMMECR1 domain-containing protein
MSARGEPREPVYESIEAALKAALRIYRENPLGASELEAFEAGFGKPSREP